jgi:hypothetical protein
MAGKVKHLINRQGNFWARILIPVALRQIIGKTELCGPPRPESALTRTEFSCGACRLQYAA